jgi:hypothetical protein
LKYFEGSQRCHHFGMSLLHVSVLISHSHPFLSLRFSPCLVPLFL